MGTMTEEEILADLEAYDQEPVPEKTPSPPATAEKGEASAAEVSQKQDAGNVERAAADAEPEIEEAKEEKPATERPRRPDGTFLPKTEEPVGKAEEISGKAEVQPEKAEGSKYEKAKKEQERQKNLLAGFDEKQKRFAAEAAAKEAELERQRQQIEEEKLKIRAQRNGQRPVDENGQPIYSSYEMRQLAKDYRRRAARGEEGSNGENLFDISERAEVEADRAAAREAKEQQELFERRQNQLAMEAMTAHPELADQNAPLTQEIQAVFAQEAEMSKKYDRPSVFRLIPDGFAMALEVAKLRQKAFGAEAKDSKIAELQAEIDRLNKLTTLGSSSPTQARQPKSPEQMSADELLDEMDKQAEKQGAKIWKR